MLVRSQQHQEQPDVALAAPLLMLPGTLCDRRVFAEMLDLVGQSGASVEDYAEAESAPDIARRILARAPEQFSLCGFSLGGLIALEIIAQAPDRVERLALIGANPRPITSERIDENRASLARARTEGCASYIPHVWDASVPPSRRADSDLRATIEAMAAAASPSAFETQLRIAANRADSRPRLSAIAVPTLIVCGTEDRICPPAMSIEMADAIPHARLALIRGAGHYVTLEQPQAVADEITAWLALPATITH
jgi:pimeloyl-ACP methyl ester carboxylesterase